MGVGGGAPKDGGNHHGKFGKVGWDVIFLFFFGAGVVREIVIFGDGLKPARPVYITCYI